jgi:hypothetical protein
MAKLQEKGVKKMNCDRCGDVIEKGEERDFHGETLCEDCYMDALSPPRACDPWAVHSAKSFIRERGMEPALSPTQAKIIEVLRETGGVESSVLVERLQIKLPDLERELAALRHMEKIRADLREGKKIIRLW